MLNIFSRRTVSPPRARFSGAAALACAWLLGVPPAHAAGAEPPEPAAATLFKQYQSWRDEPLQDWRQANERVGEIGGWRTYLREAQPAGNGADQGQHGHHGQHGQ